MCQPYLIQEVRRCQWDSYEKVRTVRRRVLSLPFAGRVLGLLEPVYLHQPLSGRADDTFVEDAGWHAAAERYAQFLRTRAGQRMLFLELGVGSNTPVFCSLRTGKSETKTLRKQRNSGHLQILTIDYAERRCA